MGPLWRHEDTPAALRPRLSSAARLAGPHPCCACRPRRAVESGFTQAGIGSQQGGPGWGWTKQKGMRSNVADHQGAPRATSSQSHSQTRALRNKGGCKPPSTPQPRCDCQQIGVYSGSRLTVVSDGMKPHLRYMKGIEIMGIRARLMASELQKTNKRI